MLRTFSMSNVIGREFEALCTMWMQPEGTPDSTDGHPAESGAFGHLARGPVGLSARWALQCLSHCLFNPLFFGQDQCLSGTACSDTDWAQNPQHLYCLFL